MRQRLALVCVFVMMATVLGSVSSASTKQDAISRFVLGNQDYKQGNYEQAIKQFQAIIDSGLHSGELYYNLGNAYFKQNEVGKAIANYERALQYIPRDSDVNFNLRYAQSLTQKRANEQSANFFRMMLDGHVAYYTYDEMVIIMTILILMLGGVLLLAMIFKWTSLIRWGVSGILSALIVVYAVGLWQKVDQATDRAIVLRSVSANFEPREEATSHFDLSIGTPVKVMNQRDGWVKVQRTDRRLGWIPVDSLEIL